MQKQTAVEKVLEVNDRLMDNTESWKDVSLSLCYLYPAILRDSFIEIDKKSPTNKLLKNVFASNHFIWKHIQYID